MHQKKVQNARIFIRRTTSRKNLSFYRLCIAVWFLWPACILAQHYEPKGLPPIYFYERSKESYIYTVLVHSSQHILCGSTKGVRVFDGNTWTNVEADLQEVACLEEASDGKVYVGCQKDLGYLSVNAKGQFAYHSLKKLLPAHTDIGSIFCVREHKGAIYFLGDKYRIRLKDNKLQLIKKTSSKVGWYMGFVMFGKLYIFEPEKGLCELTGDALGKDVSNGFIHANDIDIREVQPFDRTSYLVFTAAHGVFLFDGKTFRPYPTPVDALLKQAFVMDVVRMENGNYALATGAEGLLVLSPQGNLLQKLDEHSGLQKNMLLSIAKDPQGAVWCSTQGMVARVPLQSNIEYFNGYLGLKGVVYDVLKAGRTMYVATSEGTYKATLGNQTGQYTRFDKIFHRYTSGLRQMGNTLFLANNQGFDSYDGKTIHHLSAKPVIETFPLPGTKNALLAVNETDKFPLEIWEVAGGKWQKNRVADWHFNASIVSGCERLAENLYQIRFEQGSSFLFRFHQKDGQWDYQHPEFKRIASLNIQQAIWKGQPIYSAKGQVCELDFEKGLRVHTAFYQRYPELAALRVRVVKNTVDSDTLFLMAYQKTPHTENAGGSLLTLTGAPTSLRKQLQHIVKAGAFNEFKCLEGEVWGLGEQGLGRILPQPLSTVSTFPTTIAQVLTNGDSVLFHSATLGSQGKQVYPYSFNRFKFAFNALNYTPSEEVLYQYQLKGNDEKWSVWTPDHIKEYTNLPPGSYTFMVRAMNELHQPGAVASFEFTIATPWFRTWYAYILYGVVLVALVRFSYQWRHRQLYKEKRRLEELVAQRTEDLQEKNELLQIQTEKLAQMDRAKSNFFANISHEFKTPLTLIHTPLENRYLTTENRADREELRIMLASTQRLKRLIDQLLELAKLENNQLELLYQQGDFTAFFQFVTEPFYLQAQQKNITLEVVAPEQPMTAFFDVDKVESILLNILSNAFKFTKNYVKIALSYDTDHALLCIEDNGAGIPYEQQEHIFQRFYQMENTFYGNYDGSGIGLSLTRELLERLKGTIQVISNPDSGAAFHIRIPLQIPHQQFGYTVATHGWTPPLKGEFVVSQDYTTQTQEDIQPEPEQEGKPQLLVVEDNPDMLKYLQRNLENDYQVLAVEDGQQGLSYAREYNPDLIISDMMMPHMDGFTFCAHIRDDDTTCHIPFVLLTAKDGLEDRIAGLEFGADAYLTKPFNLHELQATIKNLLLQRKRLREQYQHTIHLHPEEIVAVPKDARFLQKLKDLLEEYLSDEALSVEWLAEQMSMEKRTLHRKVKALTNQTTTNFIRNYRLNRAYQLLQADADSIKNIAYNVGFNNLSYFSKCFKENFGILPSEVKLSEVGV